MTSLQEALHALGPTSWDDVPHSSPDALRDYVNEITNKALLIANTVPEPPQPEPTTAVDPSEPSSRITPSPHRAGTTDPDLPSLQRQWGKPLKLSAKDNPLAIPLYKLHGGDGRGAWFARRSVHEGLAFAQWQAKQSAEFDAALRVNRRKIENGQTPDYSVRGIGAEKVVEEVDVMGDDGKSVVASLKVFHVSAIFPRPTTPRDFSPLILTCECEGVESGRCWMIVSKSCLHDRVPPREGYIRGQYESVELIREIPRREGAETRGERAVGEVPPAEDSVKGRKRGKTESDIPEKGDTQAEAAGEDDTTNPVEWIMVTRSDPGGSIPRWMVEKGTPKNICTDAVKFLNWACRDGETSNEPDGAHHEPQSDAELQESDDSESTSDIDYLEAERNGLIANVSYMLNAGLEKLVPQAVRDYIPYHTYGTPHGVPPDMRASGENTPTGDGDIASPDAKGSKQSLASESIRSPDKASPSASTDSGWATPPDENGNNPVDTIKAKEGKLTSQEKQLVKLVKRKHESEARLESIRSEMQSLHLEPSSEPKPDKKGEGKGSSEQASQSSSAGKKTAPASPATSAASSIANLEAAQTNKAASGLFRAESKLLKQLAKVEKDQIKVAGKIQSQRRKAAEKEEKTRSRSEVDVLRREVDGLKKEVKSLRDERQKWLSLVRSLQNENMKLAAREGGEGK